MQRVSVETLVRELVRLPNETEWVEFKSSNFDADTIGKDISALANASLLYGRNVGYMVWGVSDRTHAVVGTDISRYSKLVGNQEIESWLRAHLSDNADYGFREGLIDGKNVVVLTIKAANIRPVLFKKEGYVRVGCYTKKLAEVPVNHPCLKAEACKGGIRKQSLID